MGWPRLVLPLDLVGGLREEEGLDDLVGVEPYLSNARHTNWFHSTPDKRTERSPDRVLISFRMANPWLYQPGSKVDHFLVVRPIDRGGMAEVYLARDTTLGRRVALKVI